MQETMITVWAVAVAVICLVGLGKAASDIARSANADEDIKRAIREGEIDNFDGKYGDHIERS